MFYDQWTPREYELLFITKTLTNFFFIKNRKKKNINV